MVDEPAVVTGDNQRSRPLAQRFFSAGVPVTRAVWSRLSLRARR